MQYTRLNTSIFINVIYSSYCICCQPDGLESDANIEVDRIVAELTAEALAPATSAPVGGIRRPVNNAAVSVVSNLYTSIPISTSYFNDLYLQPVIILVDRGGRRR